MKLREKIFPPRPFRGPIIYIMTFIKTLVPSLRWSDEQWHHKDAERVEDVCVRLMLPWRQPTSSRGWPKTNWWGGMAVGCRLLMLWKADWDARGLSEEPPHRPWRMQLDNRTQITDCCQLHRVHCIRWEHWNTAHSHFWKCLLISSERTKPLWERVIFWVEKSGESIKTKMLVVKNLCAEQINNYMALWH